MDPFLCACRRGDLQGAKRLYRHHAPWRCGSGLIAACEGGQLQVAQWIHGLGAVDNIDRDQAFSGACTNGHLEVAMWLYGQGDVDICDGFFFAGGSGHLHVAKWLYGLGGVDIHARQDQVFEWATYWSPRTQQVARWLIHLDPEYPWPAVGMAHLKTWSPARDAWMRCLVRRGVAT